MSSDVVGFAVRHYRAEDEPFVVNRWRSDAAFGVGLNQAGRLHLEQLLVGPIRRLLAGPRTVSLVVTTTADDWLVAGFAVAEPDHHVLHHVHVRRDFRRRGLAVLLLGSLGLLADPLILSTETRDARRIAASGRWDLTFRPELLAEA